ncbi:MAG: hypothetical protein ABJC87_20000 [Roseobacter sp.]
MHQNHQLRQLLFNSETLCPNLCDERLFINRTKLLAVSLAGIDKNSWA